jgi:hypothetical protein
MLTLSTHVSKADVSPRDEIYKTFQMDTVSIKRNPKFATARRINFITIAIRFLGRFEHVNDVRDFSASYVNYYCSQWGRSWFGYRASKGLSMEYVMQLWRA